ncbi:MAG TPA: pitrilysin family protein [Candidatus Limnocylindria bacterium]|nr:pitrilysin family protein [Candidatus Limnocylindria bacterium]
MVRTHTFENGLTLLMERLPHLRSAAVGVFVKAGSIVEGKDENGLSHFIEHMNFKGTQTLSARQLAEEIDLLGGNVNAATSKVATSFYARVTDKDLPRAVRLLADMMVRPAASGADFERERQVILEEIAMEADSPEDVVYNLVHKGLYGEQTLSQTILGTREAISSYTPEALQAFRGRFYRPGNAVVACAGRFDEDALIALCGEAFAQWEGMGREEYPHNEVLPGDASLALDKDIEQAHLCLSFRGLSSSSADRHALIALSTAFGGGVSSRLFQRVREERGLVYNIYSSPSFYPTCGEFTIYAACAPKSLDEVRGIIGSEVQSVLDAGLTDKEFTQTMAQLRTGFVLGMESAYTRMAGMAMYLLLHGKVVTPRESLAMMQKVKLPGVNRVAHDVLGGEMKLSAVGKKMSRRLGAKGVKRNGQA